ncbi:hypothetical protein V8C43DRAFT_269020 [Trichoderma afarasin]
MRVRERERERRERLCVSVSVSAKCVCLVLECTQKEKLTFCFRRLQESQARAVLCRLSSGTLGRVMRGERSAVHPTDALFAKPGIVPFL